VTTHIPQSCWDKSGNPDSRWHRACFDNVLLAKENSETFAQERQRNNEGLRFPSLTKLFILDCPQSLGNLFILELGLQSKSRSLVTIFSNGNIKIWHRRLGHASVETLRKLGFGDLDDCHICPQGKLKHPKFSKRTPYAQQVLEQGHSDFMGPFIEGYCGEKYCVLSSKEMSRKAFIKTLKSRSEVAASTLELIQKEQRRTQASLVYLRNDGA